MTELPSGTVTFLFTDLEGSTRLWEQYPEAMKDALARHDAILRAAIAGHHGHLVKTTGDGMHVVFASAYDALGAAVHAQLTLATVPWETDDPLAVRMGLHTGEAEIRDGDYYGSATNRAARLMSVAHGGQILVSLSTEELVSDAPPEGLSLVDLGAQRLRDLSRPERVFQVSGPGLRSDFPPIRSLDAYPGNLPLQVTSFVGRHSELVELSKILQDSRMVTLTGTGGVGKTRLAVQLAAELLQRFPDGVWLCELAAITDADAMVQVLATTLSVSPRPGVSLEGAVLEFMRSKQMLVVIDNCEHLLDAAGALADAVLRDCEHVRVVATSREALGVPGERIWPLRSLPLPDETAQPEMIEASDAGRLFSERAEASRPGFAVDASNAHAVAEVCRRLDGIPLAIELAAARVVAMTPTEIAGLLDERFRLLTGGRRVAVERHRTLRAAVEWSYSLLDPVELQVFDRLGVFAGSFDATAATAVVAGEDLEVWDVLDALASLAAKSMLVVETGADDVTRYEMLETLRQYAREQLDAAGATDQVRRRHGYYYAEFAEEAGAALVGHDELAWRPRVNADRDNLRAAVYWALDRDDDEDSSLALRIIAPLAYEAIMDPPGGVGAWAVRALECAARLGMPQAKAAFATAAYEACNLADHDAVETRASVALRDGIGSDSIAPGIAYFALSTDLNQRGLQQEAVRLGIEAAHELEQAGVDAFGRVMLHAGASYFAVELGDIETARSEAEAELVLARHIANPSALTSGLSNLARCVADDDPARALDAFEEAIALGRAGASQLMMGIALVGVADLRARSNESLAALEALRDALEYSNRTNFRPIVATVVGPGAEVLISVGRLATAVVVAGSLLRGALSQILISSGRNAALERRLVPVRERLGLDEYERAFELGVGMSYEDIIDFAIAEVHAAIAELSEAGGAGD